MLPPYYSLINSNDFNEANISFCYFTFFFFFFSLLPDLQWSGPLQLMDGPHG